MKRREESRKERVKARTAKGKRRERIGKMTYEEGNVRKTNGKKKMNREREGRQAPEGGGSQLVH